MDDKPLLVLNTCPDRETAAALARALVEQRLAACVNVLPGIESVYRWQETIETDHEVLLLIKTRAAAYPRLEAELRRLHPYELPEIIAVSIDGGISEYLSWINNEVTTE